MTLSFHRLPTVEELLAKSRSAIYRDVIEGTLPAPVQIGRRSVAWISTEIEQVQSAIITGASIDDLKILVERMHRARGYAPDPIKAAHYEKLQAKRRATLQLRKEQAVQTQEKPIEKQIQSRPSA